MGKELRNPGKDAKLDDSGLWRSKCELFSYGTQNVSYYYCCEIPNSFELATNIAKMLLHSPALLPSGGHSPLGQEEN